MVSVTTEVVIHIPPASYIKVVTDYMAVILLVLVVLGQSLVLMVIVEQELVGDAITVDMVLPQVEELVELVVPEDLEDLAELAVTAV